MPPEHIPALEKQEIPSPARALSAVACMVRIRSRAVRVQLQRSRDLLGALLTAPGSRGADGAQLRPRVAAQRCSPA